MISYADFLPYVLPDCPGCADIGAIGALASAAIEFCEKSLVLQADHDPISVKANINDYDLDQPKDHRVAKVLKVWYMRREIHPAAPDAMDDATAYNPAVGRTTGNPLNYFQKDQTSITLWPCPQADAAAAVTLRVALKPARAATSVDDVLWEDWVEVIASGAKAALQLTPGKTFSNPLMAVANQKLFDAGVNRAIVRANKGFTRANLSVRMRRI